MRDDATQQTVEDTAKLIEIIGEPKPDVDERDAGAR